ncbi:hypothetical protein [Saccharomonospora piscinae]|uniref:hypothetical protein n=1 Tax=Saccharomonospora piscinae TaxID=687388 RepID=UPI0004677DB9|nr:hypothetical protein [Saccharomonospora piscinae]
MANPLDQLYKTKLQLVAVIAVVGGVAGLMLAHWGSTPDAPAWLGQLPVGELGSTLFGTGLLAIFFEYVDPSSPTGKRTEQRISEAVRNEAPAIRDAVLDSFAFNAEALKGLASPETFDRVASGALGLRLDDAALAEDLYTDLRDQIISAPERWHDVGISVTLTPWDAGPETGQGSMFVATVRWQYRVVPAGPTMRFACVSDLAEYRELLRDPGVAFAWHFDPSAGVDAGSLKAFELVELGVDGKERPIRRTERRSSQHYTVNLGKRAREGGEVTIAYTYRVLVQRHGHLLYLPRPTEGLSVRLSYGNAGIRRVNTLDFVASATPSNVEVTPPSVPERAVSVNFDGWIFPRSGVAFVWVLEEELG